MEKIDRVKKIGDAVKSKRLSLGMTQAQAAEIIGIVPSYLSMIENCKRGPRDWVYEKAEAWLHGVNTSDIASPESSETFAEKALPEDGVPNAASLSR